MKTFKEFINEGRKSDVLVAPLRGYVKGNTIEKNISSAIEFFSTGDSIDGIIIAKKFGSDKLSLLYTAGNGDDMHKRLTKDGKYITLKSNSRVLGEFNILGWVNFNNDGIIKIKGFNKSDKISNAYTLK